MGWTETWYSGKRNREDLVNFFKEQFNYTKVNESGETVTGSVIDGSFHGGAVYLAYEHKIVASDGTPVKRDVFCIVCHVSVSEAHGMIVYKDIDENMGPFLTKCPKRILKLLTPTDNEYAQRWRENCWKRFKRP